MAPYVLGAFRVVWLAFALALSCLGLHTHALAMVIAYVLALETVAILVFARRGELDEDEETP